MAKIFIGKGEISGSSNGMVAGYTFIDDVNRANGTGILDTMVFKSRFIGGGVFGLKMGTFPLGTKVVRDYENLGNFPGNNTVFTCTGLSCDVAQDDALGAYYTSGEMYCSAPGQISTTQYYYHGDGFDGNSHSYSAQQYAVYMSATGETVAAGGGALVGGSALVGGQILCGNSPLIN